MATCLSSSFVGGLTLPSSIPKQGEPRVSSSRLQVVAQSGKSMTVRGSEGNIAKKPEGEVSRFVDTGIEKQGELWWAPLFNVSAEDQWSKLLTKEPKKEIESADQRISSSSSASPTVMVVPSRTMTTAVALPDLIADSTKTIEKSRPSYSKVAVFTPEKARALRRSLRASETWHDEWYHSAIAARLAQPVE
ncbi:unnamed protein product [Calypogeia fissa]